MAALKKKLADSDPEYTSLPTNKHKVSNTPVLSTVEEESTPNSVQSSKHGGTSARPTPLSTLYGKIITCLQLIRDKQKTGFMFHSFTAVFIQWY